MLCLAPVLWVDVVFERLDRHGLVAHEPSIHADRDIRRNLRVRRDNQRNDHRDSRSHKRQPSPHATAWLVGLMRICYPQFVAYLSRFCLEIFAHRVDGIVGGTARDRDLTKLALHLAEPLT